MRKYGVCVCACVVCVCVCVCPLMCQCVYVFTFAYVVCVCVLCVCTYADPTAIFFGMESKLSGLMKYGVDIALCPVNVRYS